MITAYDRRIQNQDPKILNRYLRSMEKVSGHMGAKKISGVAEDKIQFFSNIYAASDEEIASKITDPNYKGDILFISNAGNPVESALPPSNSLSENQRLYIPYAIREFSSNHLKVDVTVPEDKKIWLLYSDVWHPQWKATINGGKVPILKANLAYKAVRLTPGKNLIHFYFKSEWFAWMHMLIGLNCLFWFFGILYLTGKNLFESN